LEVGVRILALRDHSEAELARKLRGRGYQAEETALALVRLRELGYLDDLRFARRFAESALSCGRYVGSRLAQELKSRGVAPELVAQVMDELCGDHPEGEILAALVARRYASYDPGSATDKEKRRMINYLAAKGFSLGAIMQELKLHSIY
jgi:regulatory protein